MNYFFSDHGVQGLGLLLFFILAYLLVFWITGQFKENYKDRCRLLTFKIIEAKTVEHLMDLEDELDLMYEDFYDKDPDNVTAARIYLATAIDERIKIMTGYAEILR